MEIEEDLGIIMSYSMKFDFFILVNNTSRDTHFTLL